MQPILDGDDVRIEIGSWRDFWSRSFSGFNLYRTAFFGTMFSSLCNVLFILYVNLRGSDGFSSLSFVQCFIYGINKQLMFSCTWFIHFSTEEVCYHLMMVMGYPL